MLNYYSTLEVQAKEGVMIITLNRPDFLNAINNQICLELNTVVDTVFTDPAIKVLVITGKGRAFSAGADIAEISATASVADIYKYNRFLQDVYQRLENMDIPVIAAINGICMGGGLELSLTCDFRFASETAQFAIPEINIGIVPAGGGIAKLYKIVGMTMAREMLYTGRRLTAEEAFRLGLISRVYPGSELMSATHEFANELASKPPLALRMAKKTFNACVQSGEVSSGLELELRTASMLFLTEDRKEGMNAFLEKRKPNFRGC